MIKQLTPFVLASSLLGCESIDQDDFVAQGGISPDPTAVLEGSVLYIGPRPSCRYRPDGSVERVQGNVVLTMFEYDNPPPPEGTASSALNLLYVSGDELFSNADCLPNGAQPDYAERITRSVPFVWPSQQLYQGRPARYQIRGFYDSDEDMIPLFSVTRLPTRGDVIGAALNDIQDASKGFFPIELPALEAAPDGVVISGITVALGNPVWTERPAFRLDENRVLPANKTFFPSVNASFVPDPARSLRDFRAATCRSGDTDGSACGLTLQRLPADSQAALASNAVQIDLADPAAYAFYSDPVDIKTVVPKGEGTSGVDPLVPDGRVDPHPFLGAGLGVPWYAPIVIMQRLAEAAQAEVELQARIPRVLMVGSVLLDDELKPLKSSYVQTGVPVSVPPVAAVELIAGRAECRVPYFAPGTLSLVTDGRLGNCDELPTGHYAVNVFSGKAGGTPQPAAGFPEQSESPTAYVGARSSGQSWTVPNELGDASQVTTTIPGQGVAETFVVADPTPDKAQCATSSFNGQCQGGPVVIENALGVDSTGCLQPECCAYVSHLCGIAECPRVSTDTGATITKSPTRIVGVAANGAGIPECVPFALPWQCCRAAP